MKQFFKSLSWAVLLLFAQLVWGQSQQLSPQAQISIFTVGPGEELFTKFGHNSIRVFDPVQGFDLVFDYGTFDFDTPNFYWKFAQGKLPYMLSMDSYQRFEMKYQYFDRSYTEQVLNLTYEHKQRIFAYLLNNYQPQNRYYLYDFFYDNCATKLREVVEASLGADVQFNQAPMDSSYSFRDLVTRYLPSHQWGDLGIDLALGLPTDKVMNRLEYMFLPDYVLLRFNEAQVRINGEWQPLVLSTQMRYQGTKQYHRNWLTDPLTIFWGFFALTALLTWQGLRKGKRLAWFDFPLFLIAGIGGVIIVFLWFFTDHQAAANNFNILYLWPTHLVMAFLVGKAPARGANYWLASAALTLATLLFWWAWPQDLHPAMFPFVAALGLRAWVLSGKASLQKIFSGAVGAATN